MWTSGLTVKFEPVSTNEDYSCFFIAFSCNENAQQTYLHYHNTSGHQISTTTVPMATKLGRMVTYLEGLLTLWALVPLYLNGLSWSRDKLKIYLYYYTIPMATKFGKVVIYNEELSLIKLLDRSITWFCKVTWHAKCFIPHLH